MFENVFYRFLILPPKVAIFISLSFYSAKQGTTSVLLFHLLEGKKMFVPKFGHKFWFVLLLCNEKSI